MIDVDKAADHIRKTEDETGNSQSETLQLIRWEFPVGGRVCFTLKSWIHWSRSSGFLWKALVVQVFSWGLCMSDYSLT